MIGNITEDWGITQYPIAFNRQLNYVKDNLNKNRSDTLIFTEHYPVFTIGQRFGILKNVKNIILKYIFLIEEEILLIMGLDKLLDI